MTLFPALSIGRMVGGTAAGLVFLLATSGLMAQSTSVDMSAQAMAVGVRTSTVGPAANVSALRPGDHVRVTVWRSPELSGEFSIGTDGRLQHPFYNDIVAVGVTPETLREHVRLRLMTLDQHPEFLVEPLVRVAVGGEVRTPNLFNVAPGTTVADVILMGGGVTEQGRIDRIRVLRDGRELKVDLRKPDVGQALMPVESGDQLIVGSKRSFFRDYVVPASSLVGAVGWLVTMIVRN